MREFPKLAPEVELPRPRGSGVAVVAVAALAMFTAVGASAFVVRVRMGMGPYPHRAAEPPIAARLNLVDAFEEAVARQDDRTALELYRHIPDGLDRTGRLALIREVVLSRQMVSLEQELLTGDCEGLRRHVSWLHRVAPEEQISVRVNECGQPHYISVELAR